MDNNDLKFIQNQIGYRFQNMDLLQQAFVRRSYAKENGGEDNEVLEFIGDKVLDLAVVKFLTEKYGCFLSEFDDYNEKEEFDEFWTEYQENKLTEMKKKLVGKKTLARRMDMLGLAEYLIMGKGDKKNCVWQEDSVKEDLFEAILGAVALDSKWDFTELCDIVGIMLDPDGEITENLEQDYVSLIQDWSSKENKTIPLYQFEKGSYISTWHSMFYGVDENIDFVIGRNNDRINKIQFRCYLKIGDDLPIFRGFGVSKSEAKRAVCKLAYDYLEKHGLLITIKNEIENPNKDEAINQLEILARRGYFSIPVYKYFQEYAGNGNPVWKCECHIKEETRIFWAKASSKKEAKKSSAFKMLQYILKEK